MPMTRPEVLRPAVLFLPVLLLLLGCGAAESEPLDNPPVADTPAEAPGEAVVDVASDGPGYRDVSPDDWAERVDDPGVFVVNVHVPFEGEIPGTHAHVPFNALDHHLAELPSDLDAPVALYCMGDGMSVIAAAELAEMGYSNLVRLDGGMLAWGAAGYALEGVEPAPDAAGGDGN